LQHAVTDAIFQASLGYDINLTLQKVFQVRQEAPQIQKAAIWLQFHQDVHIAGLIRLTSGDGAKQAYVKGAVPGGDFQYFPTVLLNQFIQAYDRPPFGLVKP
jgi:hypothetical protein